MLTDVSKSFGSFQALKALSLPVGEGARSGLLDKGAGVSSVLDAPGDDGAP